MSALARRKARYQDILDLPPNVTGEIIGGVLYTAPRPAPRHARAETSITADIEVPFDRGQGGPGGWIILAEPELHLADDVMVPDLAGWRRQRLPALPDTAFIDVVPDWVCEVLSPRSRAHDRITKLARYGDHGVAWAWLVDPDARTLEIFRRDGGAWVLDGAHHGDARVRARPFDAVELAINWWWGEPPAEVEGGEE